MKKYLTGLCGHSQKIGSSYFNINRYYRQAFYNCGGSADRYDLKKKTDTTADYREKSNLRATNKAFLSYYNDIINSKIVLPQMLIGDTLTILDDSLEIKYFSAGAAHSPLDSR